MRPIDAEALISELEKDERLFDKEAEEARNNPLAYMEGYSTAMWSRANGIRDAIVEIHDAQTIVELELIRCKECEHYENEAYPSGYGYCNNHMSVLEDDDFCSRAERRKDENSSR